MCYLVAGPGQGLGGLLDGRGEVGTGGCCTGWTQLLSAHYPGSFWMCHFFDFFPKHLLAFPREEVLGCPVMTAAEGDGGI